jgi:streptogramin lyase
MKKFRNTYGNFVSWDGNFFGGGVGGAAPVGNDGLVWMDIRTGEVREIDSPSGPQDYSRGSFDPSGNIWVGGKHGVLAKYDAKTNVFSEYIPPTPYATMYNAEADKNGEVWAGLVRANWGASIRKRCSGSNTGWPSRSRITGTATWTTPRTR